MEPSPAPSPFAVSFCLQHCVLHSSSTSTQTSPEGRCIFQPKFGTDRIYYICIEAEWKGKRSFRVKWLQPVLLLPNTSPCSQFRFSWRFVLKTHSAFLFFESTLCTAFFFLFIILTIHYLGTAGAWKPISMLISKSLQCFVSGLHVSREDHGEWGWVLQGGDGSWWHWLSPCVELCPSLRWALQGLVCNAVSP